MNIKPKLYLNGSPQTAENGSLAFARNMKIDNDGNLTNDYGYLNIDGLSNYNIIGHIVGLDNKIYLFTDKIISIEKEANENDDNAIINGYNIFYNGTCQLIDPEINDYYFLLELYKGDEKLNPTEDNYILSKLMPNCDTIEYDDKYAFKVTITDKDNYDEDYRSLFYTEVLQNIENIISKFTTITKSNKNVTYSKNVDTFYVNHNITVLDNIQIDVYGCLAATEIDTVHTRDYPINSYNTEILYKSNKEIGVIVEYDEKENTTSIIDCAWKYNGGNISGYVSTNITGEKILTIAEYKEGIDIPLKHINLSYCSKEDDESIYCQAPKCPTANLILSDTYVKTIPNGVYVFFIRYKIRKDVYTNWFICSRPIFAGSSEKIETIQGGLKYINTHKDAAKSFVFNLEFVQDSNISQYKEYQLGFIITHDEATDARIWKHFDINIRTIYFDYDNVTETNIDDLLKTTYELYNVKNVTAFKNKLYISNYKETNFNIEDINSNNIGEYIELSTNVKTLNTSDLTPTLILRGTKLQYNANKNYYDYTSSGKTLKNFISSDDILVNVDQLSRYGESYKKEDVVKLTYDYNNKADPDIIFLTKVENNLHNKTIFGENFSKELPTNNNNSDKVNPFGINCLGTDGGKLDTYFGVYKPIKSCINYENNNSFYNIGLSFAFGSFNADKTFDPDYKKSALAFNAFNEIYNYNLITLNNKEYKQCWTATDGGFKDSDITYIKDIIKKEIENRKFFARTSVIITSSGISYPFYTDGNMPKESDNAFASYLGHNTTCNPFTIDLYENKHTVYKDYYDTPWKHYKDDYFDFIDPDLCNTSSIKEELSTKIKNYIYNIIKTKIYAITPEGNILLDLNNNIDNLVQCSALTVKFINVTFTPNINVEKEDSTYKFKINVSITSKIEKYQTVCNISLNNLDKLEAKALTQQPTLMPLSTYGAYIHFVDSSNIITNGIKIKDIKTGVIDNANNIITLQYKILKSFKNTNYKSFFISIINKGDIIIEGFAYTRITESNTNILNCIELDTLIYNINENITIIDQNGDEITTKANYYSSGSTYPYLAFGNCGYVSWIDNNTYSNKKLYIKIKRVKEEISYNSLIKASGFIPTNSTNNIKFDIIDGYYDSWFCNIKKPSFTLSSNCYVSGNDVYNINRNNLALKEFDEYINVSTSSVYYIKSNYNLNYLTLSEDISDKLFSIGSASSGLKQIAKVINSAILSYIYELKSMYKDFFNKKFSEYNETYKIEFDNTIRVSNVLSDETFNNSVFKFEAENYYNIPTDRGIIVSLFSIGNNIYVHTKGSLYKFDASQTIMSNSEDIQLQEAEPFSTGINQIFDSQYGYGGINNKEAGCITFDSYFFYDNQSNHIFAYEGNNQLHFIDNSIYKFLKYFKFNKCNTIHDIENNRILFEFITDNNESTTISYNYRIKNFVSFHDITLNNAFNSRNYVYSYNNNRFLKLFYNDFKIETEVIHLLGGTIKIDNLFGAASSQSFITFSYNNLYKDLSNKEILKIETPFSISIITFSKEYLNEVINNISYIGYENIEIGNNYTIIDSIVPSPLSNRFNINYTKSENKNPVNSLFVISDSCMSTLIQSTVDDKERPNSLLEYKGFKYDKGIWNANYFRNVKNTDNIYNYPNQPRQGKNPNSDNYSLMYGKYFIFTFNFVRDFPIKFESLFINTEKY